MHTPRRPTTFERLPALCLPDGTVLHRSSRATMTTNATNRNSALTSTVTSQLSMLVIRGALQIRCTGRRLLEESHRVANVHDAREVQSRR